MPHDDRFAHYDELLTRIVVLLQHLDVAIDELRAFNAQQVQINTRLETLVTRLLQPGDNGHDA